MVSTINSYITSSKSQNRLADIPGRRSLATLAIFIQGGATGDWAM